MEFLIKAYIFFIAITFLLLGCRTAQTELTEIEIDLSIPVASTLTIDNDLDAQYNLMLAFAQAYPDKIGGIDYLNNDWTMLVNGARFYYAHGRFLPENLRGRWQSYLPYDFYKYPWSGNEEQRRIFQNNPVYSSGSSFLFDALYGTPSEDESWEQQVKYNFLGVKMLVHKDIKPKLDIVVNQIRAVMRNNRTISEWVSELQTGLPSYGWVWRVIAGTNRKSLHSYGIAVDLMPRDLKGRLTYWRWNEDENEAVEINRRNYYMPPEIVIKIFEEHGFIWGGNWALIDTMHFEYRPEILILSGFTVKN